MKRRTATRADWRAWEHEVWADAREALEDAQDAADAQWRRSHPWLRLLAWLLAFATAYGLFAATLWLVLS